MRTIYRIGLIILSMVCGYGVCSFAQNVTNVTSSQVNKTIQVSYDLDKQADITLHISTDGGKTYQQLNQVSGDVGKNVSAGHKTIVWDVLAERERLVGDDVVFKVKAQGVVGNLEYTVNDVGGNFEFTVNGVSFKMIYVQGGTFTMGCTSEQGSDCFGNENPAHQVTLNDFWIGETEVTQALWRAVMGYNPSYHYGGNLPVEMVSWDDCQKFIRKLNDLTGKTFRLPTEAEWEYAARGGNKTSGYKYAGSNTIDDVAWHTDNSGVSTHPVKRKQANELGLYDMSGNVFEWCQDWYCKKYSSSSQMNPTGPSSGSKRVIRGGAYLNWAIRRNRVTYRSSEEPDTHLMDLGFRLSLVQE